MYLTYGTREVMEQSCKDLDKQLELYINEKPVALPSIEALVILNIQSWGGGVPPTVGIIPLGTGNDLSQVLGWGVTHTSDFDPTTIFEQVIKASEKPLDRWKVLVQPLRHLPMHHPSREMFMYNYMSIGVDAQVTLNFHRARESPFYIFSSRFFNRVSQRNSADVAPPQDFSDGKLEVMTVHSSFHIAQLQVGLSEPHRIGQASNIKIKLKAQAPMQVDGEPWVQAPAEIEISIHNQALVLQVIEPL
ncbi:hypothetical protein J437_LFUL019695 [Ladona fulva]|nr:hypothetical protein J437_LFUL019695 [Ladona fulva]